MQHVIRTADIDGARTAWACSCGRGGSVGERGNADLASDKHIDYDCGDTRAESSAALYAPW
jgi:hypothetical protein